MGNPGETAQPVSLVADAVCGMLALSEAELLERVASLEADVAVYRELALACVQALADLTARQERLRDDRDRLIGEYRGLRAHLLKESGAAA